MACPVGIEPTPGVLETLWPPWPRAYGVIDGSRTHAVLLHREAFYRRNPITIMVGRQRIELCCSGENAFTARPGNHPCRTTHMLPEGSVHRQLFECQSTASVEPTGIEPASVCLQGSLATLDLDPKLAEDGGLDPQTPCGVPTRFERGPAIPAGSSSKIFWRKEEVSIPKQFPVRAAFQAVPAPRPVLLPFAEGGGIEPRARRRPPGSSRVCDLSRHPPISSAVPSLPRRPDPTGPGVSPSSWCRP